MEILDAGADGDHGPRTHPDFRKADPLGSAPVGRDLVADLDAHPTIAGEQPGAGSGELSSPDGGERDVHEPAVTGSGPRRVFAVLTAPEALAPAAALVELCALTGGYQTTLLLDSSAYRIQSPQALAELYARGTALFAATALLLAGLALFRLKADHPRWVTGITGAAIIAALLLLLLAGYGFWHAGDLSAQMPGDMTTG
ncbi:MAG TPA: hypothetical protein VFP72_23240 [Kineosporiaceae bacterium]|nr:hypothetical protein [Kineosporiaceae bacterium]